MSHSRNQRKKARKSLRTEEERQVASMIRNGILPRFFLTKKDIGSRELQRAPHPHHKGRTKLTWKQEGTYLALTRKDGK